MTARNAKGQFVSDAEHAADLLLERAVAEAVDWWKRSGPCRVSHYDNVVDHWCVEQGAIALFLQENTNAASLLIDRRPAA